MSTHDYQSWGRAIQSSPAHVVTPASPDSALPPDELLLPYGLGRSYGDVCLNNGHTLIATSNLSHVRSFDDEEGVLDCEAGVTLDQILRLVVPRGWFPPVLPGTRFVTVGGCIANDIHGKNHHRSGTFGRHVRSLELLRSDGSLVRCSPGEQQDLYRATIGGLGLTGLIVSAEIALRRIESSSMVVEKIAFRSLEDFALLSRESDATHEYTVAWIDSLAGRHPRGIFFRGNHAIDGDLAYREPDPLPLPMALLRPYLNPLTVRMFNAFYFRVNQRPNPSVGPLGPFFAPLDSIAKWNALYGRRGFLQYQFVIPDTAGLEPVAEILERAALSRRASFLTVIKRFGALESPGMLSFPRAGTTVALDFPASERIHQMLDECDGVVEAAGGAVYPAKDARMSGERFRRFFPRWREFSELIDPRFSSSFWRRVMT